MENNFVQTDFAIKEEKVDQLQKYGKKEDLDDIKVKLETIVSEEVDVKHETDHTMFKREEAFTRNEEEAFELHKKSLVEREMCVIPQIREKSFQCTLCKKILTTSGNLCAHMRIHTGDKPFTCIICGRKFRQISCLKVHMRTHTGEKPYECKICLKKFIVKQLLQNHIKTHTREKYCKICGEIFFQRLALKDHMQIHIGKYTSINNRYKPEHTIVKTFALRGKLQYMQTYTTIGKN